MSSDPTLILLPGLHGTAVLFHPLTALLPPTLRMRMIKTRFADQALPFCATLESHCVPFT